MEEKIKWTEQELLDAVRIVNAAIEIEAAKLHRIVESDENDYVLLEGETSKGYLVKMMIDPKNIVWIMLNYNYPVYKVLDQDAPSNMWGDIAELVGLESVCDVDL